MGWFLLTIAFIWILGATVTDLKKREVPDWLSISLVAIALVARMIYSLLEKDISFFLQGALFFAIFFALANLFYYARIFAGGDAKLLMGLGAILAAPPVLPFSQGTSAVISIPMPFVFILNLLIVGSLYGLLFTTVVAIKNRKRFFPEFVKKCGKVRIFFLPVAALVIVVAILTIFTKSYFLLPFAVLALLFPFIHSAIKALEEVGMVSLVHPKDLALGDWLAREVRAGGKVVKPTWEGLSKKELEFLQRAKKKVLVKYGIPFVPAFLLTLLATILLGNLFEFLIRIIMPFS
ncbi:MAG TPA: prepilin peptidase [Nanoarchaeota archaeon]|nr:prepilin peptidase [Nanoarchaeota archaeon]